MIGIALTFVVLILAGAAPGQAQAEAWCAFVCLFVALKFVAFSKHKHSFNRNRQNAPIRVCTDRQQELLRRSFSPMLPPTANSDIQRLHVYSTIYILTTYML